MTTSVIAFAIAFAAGIILTPLARTLGRRLHLVDVPDGFRKIHTSPIPLAGGYAILAAFFVPLLLLHWFDRDTVATLLDDRYTSLSSLFLGAFVALFLGGADDLWDLRPRWKLLLQLVAASVAFFGGFAIARVSNPFGPPIALGLLSYPVTLLWFLGCMNAINLLDGMDGLAAGVGLFVSLTLLVVSVLMRQVPGVFLLASLSGALLAFLVFNFNPASIFLGDAGSMVIGFLIAGLSLMSSIKAEAAVALLIPFIALGLPIFDTVLAMIRRWARRMPISAADRHHVHHALLSVGMSQRKAALLLYSVCIVLGTAALLMCEGRNTVALGVLAVLGIMAMVGVRVFNILDFAEIRDRILVDFDHNRRKNQAALAVEHALLRMENVQTPEALWNVLHEALAALELDDAVLELRQNGSARQLEWHAAPPNGDNAERRFADQWSLARQLRFRDTIYGRIEVWKRNDEMPLHNAVRLLERIRDTLSAELHRLDTENATPPGRDT